MGAEFFQPCCIIIQMYFLGLRDWLISSAMFQLPPKWRVAKDGQGRVYYYHSVTKVSRLFFSRGSFLDTRKYLT
jgi:hypothetical protein